jgi:hypothetical protein
MSRKKTPVVSDDDIQRFKSVNPLTRLEARLRRNEDNRAARKLTTTYLTFEVFEAWIAATARGNTEEELRAIWMPEWGHESITLPRALIETIVFGWVTYKANSADMTLGQAFELEPKVQGGSSILKKAKTREKNFKIAMNVFIEYVAAYDGKAALNLDEAKEKTATKYDASIGTVNDAWKNHADEVKDFFRSTGLID